MRRTALRLGLGAVDPTLVRTRTSVDRAFTAQTIASFGYPDRFWSPMWVALQRGEGEIVAPPRDAAVAWFQTGRPVASAIRPGYIKTWFDVGEATGWSEGNREAAVQRAFSNDPSALCALMRSRHIGQALLRSKPGLVGATDYAGAAALGRLVTGADARPRGSADEAIVLDQPASLTLDEALTRRVRLLQVWQPGRIRQPGFAVHAENSSLALASRTQDGAQTRFDFVVQRTSKVCR